MKKLIWSAFAMSLMFLPLASRGEAEFLGLEKELLPELVGDQKFSPPTLHESSEWQVRPEKVIQDVAHPIKGQNYSIIPWSELEASEWLDINSWLVQREIKDQVPDWKIRIRQASHQELSAKFIQCKGVCSVYRGINEAPAQHLTRVLEGDEIHTEKDSVAWLYFMDGSLLRLSPESSLSVQEFNVSKDEIFILVRLNRGHFYWHPRERTDFPVEFAPETDAFSIPLMVREANQQYFERKIYQSQKDQERVAQVMDLDDQAVKDQIAYLNKLKSENNSSQKHRSRLMVVAPNATLVTSEASFDFLFIPGGKSYFKKRSFQLGEEFALHLRGYSETGVNIIDQNEWYEVETNGRSFSQLVETPAPLQITELITKRIKTIELAREIWMKEFTVPMLQATVKAEKLAQNFGYRLWNDDITKRFDYLVEYTRRIETTNLRSIDNLLDKLEANGELVKTEISDDHYRASLNHYLLGLKSRYDVKKLRVSDMNDLQYYVWILRNGKW